jgi:hypothetical protein
MIVSVCYDRHPAEAGAEQGVCRQGDPTRFGSDEFIDLAVLSGRRIVRAWKEDGEVFFELDPPA